MFGFIKIFIHAGAKIRKYLICSQAYLFIKEECKDNIAVINCQRVLVDRGIYGPVNHGYTSGDGISGHRFTPGYKLVSLRPRFFMFYLTQEPIKYSC